MNARRILPLLALGLAVIVAWILLRDRPAPAGKNASHAKAAALPSAPPEAVGPFFIGVSSLDVEANERAAREFGALSTSLPAEPAVWANLGIARLRLGELASAGAAFDTAAKLAPQDDRVVLLQATLDEAQGEFVRAIERLRSLPDPDAAALYRLADLLARTGQESDLGEQLAVLDRLRQRQPDNPVVAFARARLLARMENKALLQEAIAGLEGQRAGWSAAAGRQLDSARTAANAGNFRAAATALTFLQNLGQAAPAYQEALATLGMTGGSVGQPLRQFLQHRVPETTVAAADFGLTFEPALSGARATPVQLHLAMDLAAAEGVSRVSLSNGTWFAGGSELAGATSPGTVGLDSLCAADLDGDFRPDLAWAGPDGLKIWIQDATGRFAAPAGANEALASFSAGGASGVWVLDFEADGDLDLLVARPNAAPQLLRNQGDGTFGVVDAFAEFPAVRAVQWGDFDGDGDGDLAFLDPAGRIHVSWNERAGAFATPRLVAEISALTLAQGDVAGSGALDLVVLGADAVVRSLRFDRGTSAWIETELARWSDAADLAAAQVRQRVSLTLADIDNNGAVDLVASADAVTALWLNQGGGRFQRLEQSPALFVTSVVDLDGDGLLDLVGTTSSEAAEVRTKATKRYHWQSIHTRTLSTRADGRINSFGLGGRIEMRAGPLLASAPIVAPRTHFGLGEQAQVGVARIVWPNGVAQVEFDLKPDQEVTATQRLKGSCPWVFARDENGFRFVKDFIWRSPLGMRINSQDTAGVDQTEDWILVPGTFLSPIDGVYELRITAELWETHFFDHVSLKVVDHPAAVDAFVDERFVPTQPPELAVIAAAPPAPFAAVRDQAGRDVGATLAAVDGVHVNDFPLGQYQGVAEDHWIEFELPAGAPADRPLVLVGEGWIYPTDSSLNVAISQGGHPAPRGLTLEVYDPPHGWRATGGELGFPAGKNKTVVIPFPREPLDAGLRRFRLRTNLEIYWDRLGWSIAQPDAEMRITPVETLAAELRHRGFSRLGPPERRDPDIPRDYTQLAGTGPQWRDLEGHYTRHGDIRELLASVDDRYVIMNAGDEIVLRFAAPPAPPAGWTRDFVLVGDGWVKDGDFNTANSQTVHPLPTHASPNYGGPAQPVEEDPVFQRHADDWARFHTRYVAPVSFARGLMSDPPKAGSVLP